MFSLPKRNIGRSFEDVKQDGKHFRGAAAEEAVSKTICMFNFFMSE